MEGYSDAIAVVDRPEFISCKPKTSSKVTPIPPSGVSRLDRLMLFVGSIVEYAFGAHIGFAVGWLVGFLFGNTYVKYFKPAYIDDLSQLSYWQLMPNRVALSCAMVGVITGIIIVKITELRLLRRNIISLLNKGVTDPKIISHRLAASEKEIQKKVKRLTSKTKNF